MVGFGDCQMRFKCSMECLGDTVNFGKIVSWSVGARVFSGII